jgi:peptidoglycan/LPS O-acetylase OafA/YrhL
VEGGELGTAAGRDSTQREWPIVGLSILYRMATAPLVSKWAFPGNFLPTVTFMGRWMEFGTGMLLAWLLVTVGRNVGRNGIRQGLGRVPSWSWIVTGVLCFAVAVSDPVIRIEALPLREVLLSISTALLVIGACLTTTWLAAPLRWRPVALIGLVSYSFYLLHQNTIYYISEFLKKVVHLAPLPRLVALCTIGLGFVLALAAAFYRFIEAPTTKLGKTLSRGTMAEMRRRRSLARLLGGPTTAPIPASEADPPA